MRWTTTMPAMQAESCLGFPSGNHEEHSRARAQTSVPHSKVVSELHAALSGDSSYCKTTAAANVNFKVSPTAV